MQTKMKPNHGIEFLRGCSPHGSVFLDSTSQEILVEDIAAERVQKNPEKNSI